MLVRKARWVWVNIASKPRTINESNHTVTMISIREKAERGQAPRKRSGLAHPGKDDSPSRPPIITGPTGRLGESFHPLRKERIPNGTGDAMNDEARFTVI